VLAFAGAHFLLAQESSTRSARVTPRQLKEVLAEHATLTATAPRPLSRTILDLRELAAELDKAGNASAAQRLKAAIHDLVKRAELEAAEKKSQVARLNEEIEDLKQATAP
jgi:hypothetical protein